MRNRFFYTNITAILKLLLRYLSILKETNGDLEKVKNFFKNIYLFI